MKKKLVNYDSDEEVGSNLNENKVESSTLNRKKLDYNQLPISNRINFSHVTESDKKSSNFSDPKKSISEKTAQRVFNLPEPSSREREPKIPDKFKEKSIKLFKPKPQIIKPQLEISKDEISEEPINYFDNQLNFFLNQENDQKEDDIENNEEENADKLMEYLNKRQRNSKTGLDIQEVNGKNLLDFDWHGYRERQKIKKETSFQKNIKAPNKTQKTKHQLTYLAYEAITKQDELDDRKNEARKNHMLTQQKYGW